MRARWRDGDFYGLQRSLRCGAHRLQHTLAVARGGHILGLGGARRGALLQPHRGVLEVRLLADRVPRR